MGNNELIDAGFSQAQVIALQDYLQKKAAQVDHNLVTSDKLELKSSELLLEMAAHDAVMTKVISADKLELKQDIAKLELRIEKKFTGLHLWIIGYIGAAVSMMVALMTYFNLR